MKREIRPGEYEGILKKLRDASPPEDLFNEIFKAYNNLKLIVSVDQEEWREVTELLMKGSYPSEDVGSLNKLVRDFRTQLAYKNESVVEIRFLISICNRGFNWYAVEARQQFYSDCRSVVYKEQSRRNWIVDLEKSNAIGITTPLTGEQYTSLTDCCTPISVEYLEKMVEEAKDMPKITPEMVYEHVKQCYDAVYKDSPTLPSPAPVPAPEEKKRLSWFERLF